MTTIAPPFAPNAQDNLSLSPHSATTLPVEISCATLKVLALVGPPGSAVRSCCWLARRELSIVTVDGRGEGSAHCQSCAVHAAGGSKLWIPNRRPGNGFCAAAYE